MTAVDQATTNLTASAERVAAPATAGRSTPRAPIRLWCAPAPKADLFIGGARVVDPLAGIDDVLDVVIAKGKVAALGSGLTPPRGVRRIDAAGKLLMPGFVDLHVHLRTPGREDEEDIGSGTAAAAAGGYVAIFAMANTDPVVDTAPVLQALAQAAQAEAAVPVGFNAAMSRGLRGEQLTEMHELAQAGAAAFSDDGRPPASSYLLRRALQYAKVTGRHVAVHAEDASLSGKGVVHEGAVSARLGLAGIPSISESIAVQSALEVAAYEGGRLHLCHLSSAEALQHLARAKAAGVAVTAEVSPHHLVLTHEAVLTLEPNVKMNPPLRTEADRAALLQALVDGLIDCVATDHAPHATEEKEVPFEEAPFGCIGLETAFAVLYDTLVSPTEKGSKSSLPLSVLVERLSQAPARVAGIPVPTVREGEEANLCLADPTAGWTVDRASLRSRSHNSPWLGAALRARVQLTVAAGHVAFDAVA
jgi:dihydroorotase